MNDNTTHLMAAYARQPVSFVRGRGARLWDAEGREYLDAIAGVAVTSLGHAQPEIAAVIAEQANTLLHTSNVFRIDWQERLGQRLCGLAGMDKAFFCNSGAEANEAAMKLARKAAKVKGHPEKTEIITAEQSFHGRTLAAITATGQPKYQKSFTPLPPDYKYVPYNDVQALKAMVTDKTCAIMMEPVQGESGVHEATTEFLRAARELCDETGAALIFDEVQTGLGRTGKLFGCEHSGVKPDVMTLAKTLGGGFPIGACLARGWWADVFEPGDHASTFGGNPLACAAAIAAVTEIAEGGWVQNAEEVGAYLRRRLAELDDVKEVRGPGLMIAVEFNSPKAKKMAADALEKGLILNAIGDHILRFVPPLILTKELADRAVDTLRQL